MLEAAAEDPLDRGQALVDYLGRELGSGGSTGDFHHPDNSHFPRVLEKKRGMPLALSAVYVFVARRAGIRANGKYAEITKKYFDFDIYGDETQSN